MNKSNKGFTLVELLGVIIVLALIVTLIVPQTKKIIDQAKQKTYEDQVKRIETSAREWGVDNASALPEDETVAPLPITISKLQEDGYLAKGDIVDQRTNTNMTGCVIVYYDGNYNQYVYEYKDNCSAYLNT